MKAPFIVNEAKEALESGNSVVIGLQTTGEVQYPFEKNPPLLIHCICFGSSICPKAVGLGPKLKIRSCRSNVLQ